MLKVPRFSYLTAEDDFGSILGISIEGLNF